MRIFVVCLLFIATATVYALPPLIVQEINQSMGNEGIDEAKFIVGVGTAPRNLENAKMLAIEDALAKIYTEIADNVLAIIHVNRATPFQDNVAEHYSTVAQMPVVAIRLPRVVSGKTTSGPFK